MASDDIGRDRVDLLGWRISRLDCKNSGLLSRLDSAVAFCGRLHASVRNSSGVCAQRRLFLFFRVLRAISCFVRIFVFFARNVGNIFCDWDFFCAFGRNLVRCATIVRHNQPSAPEISYNARVIAPPTRYH